MHQCFCSPQHIGGSLICLQFNRVLAAFAFVGFLTAAISASRASITLNLTSAGASGFINGAKYLQVPDQSTGTGTIDPFVRIQENNVEHGYNTDASNVLDNKDGSWTHSLTLGAVPKVSIEGIDYRAFLLDINESGGGGGSFLSLDDVQIFIGGTPDNDVETFTSGVLDHDGTLVYHMDAGDTGNQVALDYSLNSGSGSGDMYLYVLDSVFTGVGGSANLTLYSHFGSLGDVAAGNPYGLPAGAYGNYDSTNGFEEWAVKGEGGGPGPSGPGGGEVPEAASIVVWSSLLVGIVSLVANKRHVHHAV